MAGRAAGGGGAGEDRAGDTAGLLPVRYARSGGAHIAYARFGAGPPVVVIPGFVTHIDGLWDEPTMRRFLLRLASFAEVLLVDKRGMGMSDRDLAGVSLETHVDDLLAVLDDARLDRATVFGEMDGAAYALLAAATRPDRIERVIAYGTRARFLRGDGYPYGDDPEEIAAYAALAPAVLGTAMRMPGYENRWSPGRLADSSYQAWTLRHFRMGATPGSIRAFMDLYTRIDLRPVLPSVRVPTLLLHRRDDMFSTVDHARYAAAHLPDARLVELPGADAPLHAGDVEQAAGEIEEFVTGARTSSEVDRPVRTVLFADIVDSTGRNVSLGDRHWSDTLRMVEAVVAREVRAARGTVVLSEGDAYLVTFDGPARGIRCALALRSALRSLGIELYQGLHVGEVEVRGDDVGGLTVVIARRVREHAGPGEVVVSRTVRDLVVGAGFAFVPRGTTRLKGVPDEWELVEVRG